MPTGFKRRGILGDLHRAKRISLNFDQKVRTFRKKHRDAGYPTRFDSSIIESFIHEQNEVLNWKLIPDFPFDGRKKIIIQLSFCERKEKLNKKFIAKLNWHFLTSTLSTSCGKLGKLRAYSNSRTKTSTYPMSCASSYEGNCSCGESYIGETMRNAGVRTAEHNDPTHNSEPARYLSQTTQVTQIIQL